MFGLLFAIIVAGGVGGIVNALISDNGFLLPRAEATGPENGRIIRPGFIGNVIIGGVAAAVSWGLYGPLSARCVLGCTAGPGSAAAAPVPAEITLAALVGAVLVGVGGARWLTNEVDKRLLKAAASNAALANASPERAARMAAAQPAAALEIARSSAPR